MSSRISLAAAGAAFFVLALAACGGGGESPVVHASQFAPADGAMGVDLHGTLQVTFDGALDPASVTPDHVHLLRYGYVRPVTVSYDDTTHVVTATTPGGLRHNTPYTLVVSGVHDAAGRTVADASATFSTWVNAKTSETNVDDSGIDVQYILDAAGHTVQATYKDSSGAVAWYTTYERTDGQTNERLTTAKKWGGPGPDGQWFTADDVLAFQEDDTYEANGALSSRHGSQDQSAAPTLPEWRLTYAYDAQGTPADVEYVAGGDDLVLGTGDDFKESTVTSGDADARQASQSWICEESQPDPSCSDATATGQDAFTPGSGGAPDVTTHSMGRPFESCFMSKEEDTLDARGNVIRHVEYFGDPMFGECAGLFEVAFYVVYQVDEHDRIVGSTTYGNTGPDGQWFTADDTVQSTAIYDTAH
jgi:hypothetical protein